MNEFNEWDSFYLIIGGAAGALIGLQFVVMTLIANRPQNPEPEAGHAFSTPTVLNFCLVLLIAALLRAPWQGAGAERVVWLLVALFGIGYSAVTIRRMKMQNTYSPGPLDWLTYAIFPLLAYAILLISALAPLRTALFGVAAAVLMLLFIGIYNAWDTVTYHVFEGAGDGGTDVESDDQTS